MSEHLKKFQDIARGKEMLVEEGEDAESLLLPEELQMIAANRRIAELESKLKDRQKRMDALHKANANHLDAWVDNDMTIALRKRAEAAEAALERVRGNWSLLADEIQEAWDAGYLTIDAKAAADELAALLK